jgi:hypothetical protein
MLDNIKNFYNSINNHVLTDWLFRIAFSINFALAAVHENHDASYPTVVFGLCFAGAWLYFFRLYMVSLIPIIFAGLLNYLHECY